MGALETRHGFNTLLKAQNSTRKDFNHSIGGLESVGEGLSAQMFAIEVEILSG